MAAGDGLISMTPTSIAYSGTSASINADGGVDFSAVTSLSLNGVFTGDYDNYLIVIAGIASPASQVNLRLRASGTDASGADYTRQALNASDVTVNGVRNTSQTSGDFAVFQDDGYYNGAQAHMYGPALAQPTAYRGITVSDSSGAAIQDRAVTHSLSTSYDGFSILTLDTDTFTGNIHVFGYEE